MPNLPIRSLAAVSVLVASVLATVASAGPPPVHDASDKGAPAVTEKNILASERFWPYRVALTRAWTPPGADKPFEKGHFGVLIRVEPSGDPRIDFGVRGKYAVPIGVTSLAVSSSGLRSSPPAPSSTAVAVLRISVMPAGSGSATRKARL